MKCTPIGALKGTDGLATLTSASKAKTSKAKNTKNAKTSGKKSSPKTLVIVESPAKAKTIERHLGKNYIVRASMGHLRDLPKSQFGIDVENEFSPKYINVRGKGDLIRALKKEAKNADKIYLASDPDREGEAIAWHLAFILGVDPEKDCRIVFHEITKPAIEEAVQHPRPIHMEQVDAQQARRMLDRIVGYKLSPLLWRKVRKGLSAGRVQSVTVRLICDREREIDAFQSEEYWTVEAKLKKGKNSFTADVTHAHGKKLSLHSEAETRQLTDDLAQQDFKVKEVKRSERRKKPAPPFTTSSLQQDAARKLGFTSGRTMMIAQQLYEGIVLGRHGSTGLITYMRTDSTRISNLAIDEARSYLTAEYGKEYIPTRPNIYAMGKKAQDAHEGIRPTSIVRTPADVEPYLNRDQLRLYTLIWERFTASQMTGAKTETLSYEISAGDAVFRTASTKVTDKGFYAVLNLLLSKEEKGKALPALKTGDTLTVDSLTPEQHFTQGPARYTDASIVKMLEQKGIGRPSTYAPIISVLLDRYYVNRSNKQLVPTQLGRIINDLLVANFKDVIDVNFTAGMEQKLDEIEEHNADWSKIIGSFYTPFITQVDSVMAHLGSLKGSLDEPTNFTCEKCGKRMMKKLGRFGFFLACEGFPECRNTKSIPLAKCPRPGCGGDIVSRRAKGRGKEFFGCTNFPKCNFISHFKPINALCPKCGWFMVEKYDKKNGSYKACVNPDCDYLHSVVEGIEDRDID
mgnify:CR=1 FL=1